VFVFVIPNLIFYKHEFAFESCLISGSDDILLLLIMYGWVVYTFNDEMVVTYMH
jgi:hypothetical protein